MGKLQFKNPDESGLNIHDAMVSSFHHSKTETLSHELRSDANNTTQIKERKDPARTRSRVQEKGLDQTNLLSKYARVLCCSFELERGN